MSAPAIIDPTTDPRAFRNALGAFPTGVTLITTETPEGLVGIVANSFASVSLDPPLVLWSPAKTSSRFDIFAQAERYCIQILAEDHKAICDQVIADKFAVGAAPHQKTDCGFAVLEGALAAFDCTQFAVHDAGDHAIIVGQVNKSYHHAGTPLVFHGGAYAQLAKSA